MERKDIGVSNMARTARKISASSPALYRSFPTNSFIKLHKNCTLASVFSHWNGLKPVGCPFSNAMYAPPQARTKISAPRSLSKKKMVGLGSNFCTWLSKKLINAVLPVPDLPMTMVLAMAFSPSEFSLSCVA